VPVRGCRAVLLESPPPPFPSLWQLCLVSLLLCLLGHAWFYKPKKNFADVI